MDSAMQEWFDGGRGFNFWSFLVGVVGVLLGLLGLYLAYKSKREKTPLFVTNSYEVVSRDHAVDGLEVSIHGIAVPSLTVTRISFWNAGRETMHRADLVALDPVRVLPANPEVKILGAKIVAVCRSVNDIQIATSEQSVALTFDFLDKGDGCTIDIYHALPSEFSVSGTMKGAPPARDARRARRYKVDLLVDWFFAHVARPITRAVPEPFDFLAIVPLYLPFRSLTLPFGIVEMFIRPFRQEIADIPKALEQSAIRKSSHSPQAK